MRVFVSTPVHGQEITGAYWSTMDVLTSLCQDRGWSLYKMPFFGTSDLIKARNIDVHKCLKTDATHFLSFDSDQATDRETLIGLLESPYEITAAPVRKKIDGKPPSESWNFVFLRSPPEVRGSYCTDLMIGSGAMCIRREVLLAMCYEYRFFMHQGEPVPELYEKVYTEQSILFPEQLSEDYGFCLKAMKIGIKPWMFVPGKVKHLGYKVFQGELTL